MTATTAEQIRASIEKFATDFYPAADWNIRLLDADYPIVEIMLKKAPFALTRKGVRGDAGEHFYLMSEPTKELMEVVLYYARREFGKKLIISWYVGTSLYRW